MKAEDILPDRQDRIHLGGVEIRKGSVGAFIANARLLLEEELPAAQRRQAEEGGVPFAFVLVHPCAGGKL
ncbi:hypothetical protein ACLBVZ_10540, partial [Pseudomonas aeruginosa]